MVRAIAGLVFLMPADCQQSGSAQALLEVSAHGEDKNRPDPAVALFTETYLLIGARADEHCTFKLVPSSQQIASARIYREAHHVFVLNEDIRE